MKLARAEWQAIWKAQCPEHRLDWLAPGVEFGLLDDYSQQLERGVRSRYDRLADIPKFCGVEERWGQSCDVSVKRHALHEMGELADFAAFACARAVCTGQSDCDISLAQ